MPLPDWSAAEIEGALKAALIDGLGLKPRKAFAPVRVAVSGRTVSPPLYESMELLGRERSLARLRAGLERAAASARVVGAGHGRRSAAAGSRDRTWGMV